MINFGEVLVNVLAIIGIIIAGGFLIFFLGDLLLSVLDPENSALKGKKDYPQQTFLPENNQEKLNRPEKTEVLTYGGQDKYVDVDYAKAAEEERLLKEAFATVEKQKTQDAPIYYAAQEQPKAEVQPQEDIFAQLRAEEEAFKKQKFEAAQNKKEVLVNKESKAADEDEFDFDDIFFDDEEEGEQEQQAEEPQKEEPLLDLPIENDNLEQIEKELAEKTKENEDLRNELEKRMEELESLKAKTKKEKEEIALENAQTKEEKEKLEREKVALEEMLSQVKENQVVVNEDRSNLLTLQDYQDKLVTLQERLKFNEKELRSIKKEYLPLMRVRKNLDNDKKKLRRKEALVAKQKVVLYGVNNIVDIDEAKAKKLAEDLDLLDGLRLSVQHCEEVIKNSSERYPILETSYRILSTSIKEIKSDIEEVEKEIKNFKK